MFDFYRCVFASGVAEQCEVRFHPNRPDEYYRVAVIRESDRLVASFAEWGLR